MLLFSSIGTWSVNRGFNTTNLGAKLQPPFVDALISQENRASFLLCSCVWYIEGIYTSDPLIRVCIFGKDFPSFSCISNFVVSINEFLLWIKKKWTVVLPFPTTGDAVMPNMRGSLVELIL